MRWADLENDAPRLAERARERLVGPGVVLVATVRRDGTPRLSPVEPLLLDGDFSLSMMWQSRKVADLVVDDRILVHSAVTGLDGDEGESKLRGRALPIDDAKRRVRYCDAVQSLGWRPLELFFHLFVESARPRSGGRTGVGRRHTDTRRSGRVSVCSSARSFRTTTRPTTLRTPPWAGPPRSADSPLTATSPRTPCWS